MRKAMPPTYTLNLNTTFTLNLNLNSTLFKPRLPTPKALITELEDYIYNLPMYQILNLKKKDLVVCESGISNYIPWHLSIILGITLNDTWPILVWEPAENLTTVWYPPNTGYIVMGAMLNSPQWEVILFSVLGTRSSQCSSISVLGLGNSSLWRGPLYCSFSLLGAWGTRRRQRVLNLPVPRALHNETRRWKVRSLRLRTLRPRFVCPNCFVGVFCLFSRVAWVARLHGKENPPKKRFSFTTLHWLLGRGWWWWWWSWPFCELEQWCWRRRWPRARQLRCVAE